MTEISAPRKSYLYRQGRKIAAARAEADITQQQLSDRASLPMLTRQAISEIERGVRDVSWEEMQAIATATEKPIEYFKLE